MVYIVFIEFLISGVTSRDRGRSLGGRGGVLVSWLVITERELRTAGLYLSVNGGLDSTEKRVLQI